MSEFILNGKKVNFSGDPTTPLLWYLRDEQQLTGTKYGCGAGLCGACTVHIDGVAQRSCVVPVSALQGKQIQTIEGIGAESLHPVQQAWLELDVAQCGYCQTGQIMAAASFLQQFPTPSDEQIDQHITNLCRCGTYVRIRQAIHRAAGIAKGGK